MTSCAESNTLAMMLSLREIFQFSLFASAFASQRGKKILVALKEPQQN